MEAIYCQSCGMPLKADTDHGTNKNGSLSEDYCTYCYKEGAFTRECSMDEMIETCAQFLGEFNKDSEVKLTKEQAIAGMKEHFPKLKRWTD